jgi:TolA-binding protein
MPSIGLRWGKGWKVALLAALLGATAPVPTRAQLGVDLSEPSSKKKKTQKKPPPRKKPPEKRPPARTEPSGKPESEARPAPEQKPAPTLSLDSMGVSGKSAGRQQFDGAQKQYQEKNYETAALAFAEIIKDPNLASEHEQARYWLAKTLAKMGLYHSALNRFNEILVKGAAGSKFFRASLEWLFYIGKRTVNEQVILNHIARYANEQFPPKYADKFHYLLAKYHFERGRALDEAGQPAEAKRSFDEARRLVTMVRPPGQQPKQKALDEEDEDDSISVYAKAKFLSALLAYQNRNFDQALDGFKEVVRLTNPRKIERPNLRLRELAFLELARLHYEHKQNRYAIFYYNKMPWGGDQWLEGLWESSYGYYRIGDYEKALGNFITLHSPFFKEEYFPESYILKAIIYYENCRYREARAILEDFNTFYEPVHSELEKITAKNVPNATYFEMLESAEKSQEQSDQVFLMRKILRVAFTDRNVKRLNDSILEIEKEMDNGVGERADAFRYSDLAKSLIDQLKAERQRLVEEAGARARQKMEYERDALRELLQQALRIKIEVSAKERYFLQSALEKGGNVEVVKKYKFSAAVSDEHEYWPYEGEFWRDELGTYAYTLTRGCREGPTPRPQGKSR